MDKNSIAAQLYTLREYLKTPEDIFETLKRVRKMGYNAVQVSGMGPIAPDKLKKMVDELGLKICATHISYDRLKDDLDAVIEEHKLWNCDYIGLGAVPSSFRYSLQGYKEFLDEVSVIVKKIYDNGLKFIYHNHSFEFEKFNGTTALDYLFDNSDPKAFGFELDTYWVQCGGANPVNWIKKVKGRMQVVHFKDMAIKENNQVYAEIGEGNLDWPEIIKACRETGVKWYAVEQDVCLRDPFESLEMSIRYLEKFI